MVFGVPACLLNYLSSLDCRDQIWITWYARVEPPNTSTRSLNVFCGNTSYDKLMLIDKYAAGSYILILPQIKYLIIVENIL